MQTFQPEAFLSTRIPPLALYIPHCTVVRLDRMTDYTTPLQLSFNVCIQRVASFGSNARLATCCSHAHVPIHALIHAPNIALSNTQCATCLQQPLSVSGTVRQSVRTALLIIWPLKPAVSSDWLIPAWQGHKIRNT